ncbi:MAG: hypothetical protein OQL28_10145 [Sedimenticola sp.]|nr:hypothetical protein [Sedimenticola sp.]
MYRPPSFEKSDSGDLHPISISIASHPGLPAEPFVLEVLFAANINCAMSMGYQNNLLIRVAGTFRFNDFLRVGIPPTLIM